MSQTVTVSIEIDGNADRFTIVLPDRSNDIPARCAEVAGLLAARIRDAEPGAPVRPFHRGQHRSMGDVAPCCREAVNNI